MAKYVYPAVFTPEADGGYSIRFPDVAGCYSQCETLEEGIEMAKDALCLMLYDKEERREQIPAATALKSVHLSGDEFASLISC